MFIPCLSTCSLAYPNHKHLWRKLLHITVISNVTSTTSCDMLHDPMHDMELLKRPFQHFWTGHIQTSRPYSLKFLIAFFHAVRVTTLSLSSLWVDVHFGSKVSSLSPCTVHFDANDRPVWLKTVLFQCFGPSTLDLTPFGIWIAVIIVFSHLLSI